MSLFVTSPLKGPLWSSYCFCFLAFGFTDMTLPGLLHPTGTFDLSASIALPSHVNAPCNEWVCNSLIKRLQVQYSVFALLGIFFLILWVRNMKMLLLECMPWGFQLKVHIGMVCVVSYGSKKALIVAVKPIGPRHSTVGMCLGRALCWLTAWNAKRKASDRILTQVRETVGCNWVVS